MGGMHAEGDTETIRLPLEAVLDASKARALHARLNELLNARAPVVLDASRVERIDTAAAQTLYAFCRAARERGIALQWGSPSAALRQAAGLLGLTSMFGDVP